MKKKLASVLALSMAMALTFGMTVFAAESPDTTNTTTTVKSETVAADTTAPTDAAVVEELNKEAATLSKDVTVTLPADSAVKVKEVAPVSAGVLNNTKTVADTVAKKAVTAAEGKTVVATPVAAVDVKIEGDIPEEGITLTISVPGFKRDASKSYIVLHLNEQTNVWETIEATVADGKVTATFKSLSPIVLVEVDQKDAPASTSNSGSNNNTSAPAATSPAESPKTGETLPVAGVLAVVCLAAAAVSAKKIRYNR